VGSLSEGASLPQIARLTTFGAMIGLSPDKEVVQATNAVDDARSLRK
jgi:hypothetical protein